MYEVGPVIRFLTEMALRQVAVWGSPKTASLQLINFLGGLAELRKAITLVTTVYYRERTQTQASEGKKRLGRVQGRISRCPLLAGPGVSAASWESGMRGALPTRRAHLGFLRDLSLLARGMASVSGLFGA